MDEQEIHYLKGLTIEQLLQTEVTSVSKKSEPLFDTAAAVSVITAEDIRRAGIQTIAEALRMVPGMHTAAIDASRYAVSSRGFSDYFAGKMLVMIDGRSVYTPLFSGVYWNGQDTFIEDIDRIEVIRGPGATVWGANAVNGVINIITSNSRDTQGGLVAAAVGTHEQPNAGVRYGGELGVVGGTYRVFAKGFNRGEYESVDDGPVNDSRQSLRTGFRADFDPGNSNTLSIQGEIYDGDADAIIGLSGYLTPPYSRSLEETENYSGGHLMVDWKHEFSEESGLSVQMYYDRTERDKSVIDETRDTVDFEMKHHWRVVKGHDIVWGAGYRWSEDDIIGTWSTSFTPDSTDNELLSAFVQDDIMLVEDRAWLTVGSKFEHNDYTGYEIQPSIRVRVKPVENQLAWAAVSRAVRTPSRAERDITVNLATSELPGGGLAIGRISGDEDFTSEEMVAYEAGWRFQANDRQYYDLAVFYHDYDKLRSILPGEPFFESSPAPPHLVLPLEMGNEAQGSAYGVELQSTWQVTGCWKLFFNYSWLQLDLEYTEPGLGTPGDEGTSPQHQAHIRSYLDLPDNWYLDSELYYVSELDGLDIDGYVRFDLRLAWMPTRELELSLNAENLFNSAHQEYSDRSTVTASEVPTQVWAKIAYSF